MFDDCQHKVNVIEILRSLWMTKCSHKKSPIKLSFYRTLAEREAPELIESVKIIESQNSKYQLFIKLLISWSIIKTIWLYKKLGVNLGVILKRTQL